MVEWYHTGLITQGSKVRILLPQQSEAARGGRLFFPPRVPTASCWVLLQRRGTSGICAGMPYKDGDQRRAYGREWMRRNGEKARDAMRRWRETHRDADRSNKRAYYAANTDRERLRTGDYARRNPEIRRVIRHQRRGREMAAEGSFTHAEWRALLQDHDGRCAYCGETRLLTADHKIALARGGSNRIDNILPACRRCNQRKHTSSEREFRVRLANERLRSAEFVVVDWWSAGEIESLG